MKSPPPSRSGDNKYCAMLAGRAAYWAWAASTSLRAQGAVDAGIREHRPARCPICSAEETPSKGFSSGRRRNVPSRLPASMVSGVDCIVVPFSGTGRFSHFQNSLFVLVIRLRRLWVWISWCLSRGLWSSLDLQTCSALSLQTLCAPFLALPRRPRLGTLVP